MPRGARKKNRKTTKMTNYLLSSSLFFAITLMGCQGQQDQKTIFITNPADFERMQETVSVPVNELKNLLDSHDFEDILVQDLSTGKYKVVQWIDNDADGKVDNLLFQVDMDALEKKEYVVLWKENGKELQPASKLNTYSRIVPERTDDYTWENDRVAFRTYGPEAERLVVAGEPGGTLSSGIDAWFKRVEYPIIDKWYAANDKEPGYYHIDHGEGYDPYHVGASRGIGGTGVWMQDSIYVSRNFISYKRIATGPIRTVFELSYAPYEVKGQQIQETKLISLDLGSNLSRFEVSFNSDQELPNAVVGITLHDQKGEVTSAPEQGWVRYWEPMDGSELGLGLVMDPEVIQEVKERRTSTPDQSHILILANPKEEKLTYYAGFGWKKSGQFNSVEEWDQYLMNYAKRIDAPLQVEF